MKRTGIVWQAAMICALGALSLRCSSASEERAPDPFRLICLDPGHFHAALVQKYPNERLDSLVYVYAPEDRDLEDYLALVESFNRRSEQPTAWHEQVYRGADFLEKMIQERPGDIVLLAGNNRHKIDYLEQSVTADLNVLADKPLIIDPDVFSRLERAYTQADRNGVLIYDIMTERYDVLHRIQRALMQDTLLFGHLTAGTDSDPAVTISSVHAFYKEVAGSALTRPGWYYDIRQQGEGIVDVTTHLIDLVNWKCFPDRAIDYRTDVQITAASHFPTPISKSEFTRSTGLADFPAYLTPYLQDSTLQVMANGEIRYTLCGHRIALRVEWEFEHPDQSGDISRTDIRGSRATTHIWQDKAQNYRPTLYIAPADGIDPASFRQRVNETLKTLQTQFPGIGATEAGGNRFEITVPDQLRSGHEAHFAAVLDRYLDYLSGTPTPDWEKTNTLTKYYITTQALRLASSSDQADSTLSEPVSLSDIRP